MNFLAEKSIRIKPRKNSIWIKWLFVVAISFLQGYAYGQTNSGEGELIFGDVSAEDSIDVDEIDFTDTKDKLTLEETMNTLITNHRDPDVFYDLGVVSYQNNHIGNAILNLKRAYQLAPYDREIRQALFAVRATLGIPAYLYETSPLVKVFLFPFTVFKLNAMAWIGLFLFGLGSAGLCWLFLSRIKKDETLKRIRTLTVIAITVGMVYLISALIRYRVVFNVDQAVIMEESLLYSNAQAEEELDNVQEGLECTVLDSSGEYLRIETVTGERGWIESNVIERVWCLNK